MRPRDLSCGERFVSRQMRDFHALEVDLLFQNAGLGGELRLLDLELQPPPICRRRPFLPRELLFPFLGPPKGAHQHVAASGVDVGQGHPGGAKDEFADLVRMFGAA
jgi:hypothetical protein